MSESLRLHLLAPSALVLYFIFLLFYIFQAVPKAREGEDEGIQAAKRRELMRRVCNGDGSQTHS